MAILTGANTAVTLDAANNIREDLGNVIFNVSPFKTPFFSSIAKSKATNDNHEWLTDTLRAAVATNKNIEADTGKTYVAPGTRTRKGNYLQIAQEDATVTLKAELLDKAGIPGKEMAYQLMKVGKELQMDVETQMLSLTAKVPPDATTAGVSGSVAAWITTNESVSGTGGSVNPETDGSDVPTPGTNRGIAESYVTDMIDAVWEYSGDLDNHCIMGNASMVGNIRALSGMSDETHTMAKDGTVYARVTVYLSQFGPVKVIPNKHMPANTIYILDTSSWAIAFAGGKAIHTTDIAVATSAERKLLEMYYTLEARSEEANAGIYAIT